MSDFFKNNPPEIKHYLNKFVHDTNMPLGRIYRNAQYVYGILQDVDFPDKEKTMKMLSGILASKKDLQDSIDYTYTGLMKIQNRPQFTVSFISQRISDQAKYIVDLQNDFLNKPGADYERMNEVLGSASSVLAYWHDQLKKFKP